MATTIGQTRVLQRREATGLNKWVAHDTNELVLALLPRLERGEKCVLSLAAPVRGLDGHGLGPGQCCQGGRLVYGRAATKRPPRPQSRNYSMPALVDSLRLAKAKEAAKCLGRLFAAEKACVEGILGAYFRRFMVCVLTQVSTG